MNLAGCLLDHFQWISQHFLQSNQNKTEQQKAGSCSVFVKQFLAIWLSFMFFSITSTFILTIQVCVMDVCPSHNATIFCPSQ